MSNTWQVGFARETVDVPGATISSAAVGVAVVQATRNGLLVRLLETTKSAALDARLTHVVMDIGSRYDVSPRVCGPSEPGRCWNAPFIQCGPTGAGLARLRDLLAAGVVRLANGHQSLCRPGGYVAPALPQEPPVTPFVEARSSILAGGDGGALGLALAAAVHGLSPIPEPPTAPAAPAGVWRVGPH